MKARNAGLLIFFCIIIVPIVIILCSVAGVGIQRPVIRPLTLSGKYAACVHVSGVIGRANSLYNQEWLLKVISQLKNDEKNIGLILVIDSPGGSVYETDEVYHALRGYAAEGKAIWAYLGRVAASGGYYIACAADHIIANRNTLTGSIGVIAGQSIDLTGLMTRYGVKVTTFTAGKNKNMLNFDSPVTVEQSAIMQSIADERYDQFVEIVAEARRLSLIDVRNRADGRVYTALQALDAGLVDAIATFDDALSMFTGELRGAANRQIEFKDFRYKKINSFAHILGARLRLLPDIEARETPQITFPAYLYPEDYSAGL